jgi:hypothetical protein
VAKYKAKVDIEADSNLVAGNLFAAMGSSSLGLMTRGNELGCHSIDQVPDGNNQLQFC